MNRTAKPDYKFMHVILNQCLRLNMGKAVFSVLFYILIMLLLLGLVVMPALSVGEGEGLSPESGIAQLFFPLLFCVAAIVLLKMLSYGLTVIMSRMVEKKHVTIGYLFFGFRKGAGRILRAGLVYAVAYLAVALIVSLLILLFGPQLNQLFPPEKIPKEAVLVLLSLASLIPVALLHLPFSFLWPLMYKEPELGVFASFAKAFRRMRGHFFHFIGFELYAGGKDLIAMLVLQGLLLVMPQGESVPHSLQALQSVLGFAALVEEYRTIVRLCMALSLYYDTLVGVIRPLKEAEPPAPVSDAAPAKDMPE